MADTASLVTMDTTDTVVADNSPGRRLWGLVWLGLGFQALLAFWISRPWETADSQVYLELAQALSGGRYERAGPEGPQPDALRPPGYPLFLCLALQALHLPVAGVVLLQVGMYLAGLWMLQRFAIPARPTRHLFAALALVYPFQVLYAGKVMAEALTGLLLAGMVVVLSRSALSTSRWMAAAALGAVAALVRSDLILLPVGLAVAAGAYRLREKRSFRTAFGLGLATAVAGGILLLPYAIWNLAAFGRLTPVPIAGAAGNSLYLATWQSKLSLEDLNALYGGQVSASAERQGLGAEIRRLNGEIGAPPLTAPFNPAAYATPALQSASSRVFGREALRRIRSAPGEYARHVAANTWRLWNTSRFPDSTPAVARALLGLTSGLVCGLGLAGVACAFIRPEGWTLPATSAVILLYLPAIHVWLHTEARYTAPVRMLLLMNAAAFLVWGWSRWRLSRKKST